MSVHLWFQFAYHVSMLRICVLALLLLLLSVGCVGINRPEAEVSGVRIDETAAAGGRLLVDVQLINPNNEDLAIPRVNFQIDVIGAGKFAFTDVPYATLPREGMHTLTLPAAMHGAEFSARAYRVDGTVVFKPDGNVRQFLYDLGLPLPESSFSAEGVLE